MRIKVSVSTNKVGSEVEDFFEIDDEELEGLTPTDIRNRIEDAAKDTMINMISWDWEIEEK